MRAAAWNLGHRTFLKPIHPDLVRAVVGLEVDVIVFNEFVDGPGRAQFRADLDDAGFGHQVVSLTPARHNQVLIASKTKMWAGDLRAPQFDGSAISNFQHVVLPDYSIELVGLRVPFYERKAEMNPYLAELGSVLEPAASRPLVVAGDFNIDPFAKSAGAGSVPWTTALGLTVHEPAPGWSFHSGKETAVPTRIDHVAASALVDVSDARYVTEIDGLHLAGPDILEPISDHGPVVFTAIARP
jgi:hypothetical protein